jgi:hypothetical protein
VELKDYVQVLRRVNEARKIGEDAGKVLKEMNPRAQLTMAAVLLREWLADSSKELDHEVVKTKDVKSDTGFSHLAKASKSSRESLASAIQLKPGSTEADTKMGEAEQTSSARDNAQNTSHEGPSSFVSKNPIYNHAELKSLDTPHKSSSSSSSSVLTPRLCPSPPRAPNPSPELRSQWSFLFS